jgi:hypothetical protein
MPPVTFKQYFFNSCQLIILFPVFSAVFLIFSAKKKKRGSELKRLLKKNFKEVGFFTHVADGTKNKRVIIFYHWNNSMRSRHWQTVL